MRQTEDTYRHKGLRKKLVETVRGKGITDEKILAALEKIPRHFFLDSAFDEVAYEDKAFPISEGQTISQPYTVAYQTQLLQVKPFDKVLEIGTGSAYQAFGSHADYRCDRQQGATAAELPALCEGSRLYPRLAYDE